MMSKAQRLRVFQERSRAFTRAAGAGDLKLMRALIGEDRRVLVPDTSLLEACLRGQVEAVRLMLDEGVSPNPPPGKDGNQSRRAITRVIRRTKAVPWTPRHRQVLELLLERGATIGALPGWDGASGLSAAASAANREAIEVLRRHHPKPLDLFDAAALGERQRVEELLAERPQAAREASAGGATALQYCAHSALGEGDPARATALRAIGERLIDLGAPLDPVDLGPQTTYPAIYLACRAGNDEVAVLLLERGADPQELLLRALVSGRARVLERLALELERLDLDHRLDDRRRSPLLVDMVRSGQLRSAAWLIEHGADLVAGDTEGSTALHLAARRGAANEFLQLLIDRGAPPAALDNDGRTPLDLALARRKSSAAKLLRAIAT